MDDSQQIISLVQDEHPQKQAKETFLQAAHALTGTLNKRLNGPKVLEDALRARLLDVKHRNLDFLRLSEQRPEGMDVDALQYLTGGTALKILEQINVEERRGAPFELSLTDQSALRMLASLVFQWKLSKETQEFMKATPSLRPHALNRLQQTTVTLLRIVFPEEETTRPASSHVSNTVGAILLQNHVIDILPSTFCLGWLPLGEGDEGSYIRSSTLRLLSSFGLGESMQLLGLTLQTPNLPATAKNAIKYFLSRRILHPNGLRAFLNVMVAEEHDGTSLAKYEQIGTLLSTPPRGTSAQEYFRTITSQILKILLDEQPASRTPQVASYVLSTLLSSNLVAATVSPLIDDMLYLRFREHIPRVENDGDISYMPLETIKILSRFLVTAPPTSDEPLIVKVLEPIVEKLYSLLYYLETTAISDPTETEACKGLLFSWLKVALADSVSSRLWNVMEGKGGEWFPDEELVLRWRRDIISQNVTLSSLGDLEKNAMNANSLNLRPDPIHLVSLLKSVNRKEVASLLFIRILGAEHDDGITEPTRELLRMQLLYQMQQQLPSSILSNPSHALAFVDHVISTSTAPKAPSQVSQSPLRFVKGDEDDEADSQTGDILRTAVDFLLSSLEANPDYIPPANDPHVQRVEKQLKDLSLHSSMALRQASREASLVLIARLSNAAVTASRSDKASEEMKSSRERYQEALVLLQDPLLPVRAQGLAALRHLVEPTAEPKAPPASVDAALIPAILNIFVNSAQNEDSFIFLNAVKGLAAMVHRFGTDVFRRLLEIYVTEPSLAGGMNRQELDMKLRIGEALGEVIGSSGQSLSGYVDGLVPAILATIREQSLPTTLRTSAISLASRCVESAPLAISKYGLVLSNAMVDILELEHIVLVEPLHRTRSRIGGSGGQLSENTCSTAKEETGAHNRRLGEAGDLATDSDPVGINPKLSPLRRSAIHLLGAIILQFLRTVREGHGGGVVGDAIGLDGFPVRRAATVLRYLSVHDADAVVNTMAVEVVALLAEVARARLGLSA